jgi:hypothetical protein
MTGAVFRGLSSFGKSMEFLPFLIRLQRNHRIDFRCSRAGAALIAMLRENLRLKSEIVALIEIGQRRLLAEMDKWPQQQNTIGELHKR